MLKSFLSSLLHREPLFLVSRSPQWRGVRKQFLIDNNNECACCLKTKNLNVHHIIPVHIDASLELEKSNLMILCENKTLNCHLVVGHCMDYSAFNPDVLEDVKFWRDRIKNRKYS